VTPWAFVAVGVGATFGAWLRWALSTELNPVFPALPLGTLVANLFGGYLVGVAVAFFAANAHIAPEWRLLCITGFLGALTTFSTFSAESVQLMLGAQYGAAFLHSAAHLLGSLAATFAGFMTYRTLV
jgi:CrcB protein